MTGVRLAMADDATVVARIATAAFSDDPVMSWVSRATTFAVLQPVLERCDADGTGAYLESTNPRNHTLYHRHGFVDVGEIQLDGGPVLVPMWRDPR